MSRMAAVTRGTPEQMATPVTCSENVRPCRPISCANNNASSSDVRSALVAIRQWSTSFTSSYMPMTVLVLPTSIASNTSVARDFHVQADVEDRCRMRERADRDDVGAGGGVGRDRLK